MFDFGSNWRKFIDHGQSACRISEARESFEELFRGIELKGKRFLDIGFGQGNTLLLASLAGAYVCGLDISELSKESFANNRRKYFPSITEDSVSLHVGSILDKEVLEILGGGYDIVHSWGVLHHTGKMYKALCISASMVLEGGYLVVALYNRHWSSILWVYIKRIYNWLPKVLKRVMIYIFYPIIYISKYLVTKESPLKQERGMDFYYNVIDWVGGYPYEYASKEEVLSYLLKRGFKLLKYKGAQVPTGCNEYVFEKTRAKI